MTMADAKPTTEAAKQAAPAAQGAQTEAQKGPEVKAPEPEAQKEAPAPGPAAESGDKTYYLRPNVTHVALVKGERMTLTKAGETTTLTASQYAAMSDRFFTEAEFDAYVASVEAALEEAGASAAELDA
jgi:hypothetical protein